VTLSLIKPNWPAPGNIHAFTTTRQGGLSLAPYDSFNLALHVGDEPTTVEKNRALLTTQLSLPQEPAWLSQTHSTEAVSVDAHFQLQEADASYSREHNKVCVVLTADCLPLLICDTQGTEIAAIHAGWKGLAHGIIENTIAKLTSAPSDLLVWLGPAAGPSAYEVGSEVRDIFLKHQPDAEAAFTLSRDNHYWMDIYHLARQRLTALGISKHAIYGGEYCTMTQTDVFYSYRRAPLTGRFATLIWKTP